MADGDLIRIPPFHYIHVINQNNNLTSVIEGPITYVRQEHEQLIYGPEQMIQIPPRYYTIIQNPIFRTDDGQIEYDQFQMAKVQFGEREIRTNTTHPDPFPLYPWEVVDKRLSKIRTIDTNHAYMLRATRDFIDNTGIQRKAGNKWLHHGPCSYVPQVACEIFEKVKPIVIIPNTALKMTALRITEDIYGNERLAGEEWLIRETGAYLPLVYEKLVQKIEGIVLTERKALHLRSLRTFKDIYGKERQSGEEWLVTLENSDTHIPDVFEEVVKVVEIIVLSNRQFCYILDPVDQESNKNQFGQRELRAGETSFFLQPNEFLENGIQNVYVLSEDEALLLKARQNFTDGSESRIAGDK